MDQINHRAHHTVKDWLVAVMAVIMIKIYPVNIFSIEQVSHIYLQ